MPAAVDPKTLEAIAKSKHVRVLLTDGREVRVIRAQAEALARGGGFVPRFAGGKLRYLKEIDHRRQLSPSIPTVWRACWRTLEAAVLQVNAVTGEYTME